MTPAWAQRQEALLHDCIVSPDVFDHMVERLRDFAVPYQHALETQAGKRAFPVHRRNFVRKIRIAFVNNHLQALAKNEG